MKKIALMVLTGISFVSISLLAFNQTSQAAEVQGEPILMKTNLDFLDHLKDSDSLLCLPDGGFLHGTAELSTYGDDKVLEYYNSDTDSNATTVGTVKKALAEMPQEKSSPFIFNLKDTRGAKPATQVMKLGLDSSYSSSKFSASGIRFAGYLFQTKGTAGDRLRYYSYNTVGAAGSKTDASKVYSSNTWNAYGWLVYSYTYTYVGGVSTYWVNNPNSGTYYYVINK
ncbi:hypothetical protein [Enterococcus diestrammenae]|uniref:hypothetical protein n=1 Tax=Enterococcus diestrammenae TaxID=1155073 RepID=UPI00195DCFF3